MQMQFATELIEQAQLHYAAQVEAATSVVVDDLMKEYDAKFEQVKRAYAESFEHVELVAISELMKGTVLKIFDAVPPASVSDPDQGRCLVEIELGETPFKRDGDRLVLNEPLVGWAGVEAGRGRLARAFRFERGAECVAQGTVSEPEGNGVMRLQRPAIKTGQKIVVAEFSFELKHE